MSSAPEPALEVFVSYAHEDDHLRAELEKHLSLLRRQGTIRTWNSHAILPGEEWDAVIARQMDSADIFLLLISADFLDSDYCYDREMGRAMERHQAGEARVIPVLLRTVEDGWRTSHLGALQVLPRGGKPVTAWEDQDAAFADVARWIRAAAEQLRGARSPEAVPRPAGPPVENPRVERVPTGGRSGKIFLALAVLVFAVLAAGLYLWLTFEPVATTELASQDSGEVLPVRQEPVPVPGVADPEAPESQATEITETAGAQPPPQTTTSAEPSAEEPVRGRLEIVQVAGNRETGVSLDYAWQTGNYFRLKVTSNRAGWLYVFHRPPNGELALLWPQREAEAVSNAIRAGVSFTAPTDGKVFEFTEDTGLETFYVALTAKPKRPDPRLGTSRGRVEEAEAFITRSLGQAGSQTRGVIITDPSLAQPFLTFTPEAGGDVVAVDFQLRHGG